MKKVGSLIRQLLPRRDVPLRQNARAQKLLLLLLTPLTAFWLMQLVLGSPPWNMSVGVALANWLCLSALYWIGCAIIGYPAVCCVLLHILAGMWGAANYFVSVFRGTPILPWDFKALGTAVAVAGSYSLSMTWQIAICIMLVALLAWALRKALRVPSDTAILVGVGSSICGGSAIAATAPVIGADDNEVAQSISVIFFFNVLAAIFFPMLGSTIGFDTSAGDAFGIFAGTAINDTSSVTAAASTWDSMWNLGSETLHKAVTVKLTRTLAIIPITLVLAVARAKKSAKDSGKAEGFNLKRAFPMFILYFVIASVITTVCIQAGMDADVFAPLKDLSKFFIIMAMAAIGLNSNVVQLVKSGGRPLLLGGCCWIGITAVILVMQHVMGIW